MSQPLPLTSQLTGSTHLLFQTERSATQQVAKVKPKGFVMKQIFAWRFVCDQYLNKIIAK